MVDPYRTGLIGNGQSCALVDEDARIVWACLPRFDSPSVFAEVLDPEGGHFAIEALNASPVGQRYLPRTNILVTRFEGEAAFEVVDWMPLGRPSVHRLIRPLRGTPRVRIDLQLKPDYARATSGEGFFIQSNIDRPLDTELALSASLAITLSHGAPLPEHGLDLVEAELEAATRYWEQWSAGCQLPEANTDAVLRAALTLKLMCSEETGAVIAAPTTSLPEDKGGVRNWDYRFCWLRDAYFTVDALAQLGQSVEHARYLDFVEGLRLERGRLQPLFGIDGRRALVEESLDHLAGAFDSRPVRIGNQAYEHVQNDVCGELMLTLARGIEADPARGDRLWPLVVHLADEAQRVWRNEDAGIWEYRDQPAHYVFSKVMCWVALDRAVVIAEGRDQDRAARWREEAELIREEVLREGWDEEAQAFTGAYGIQHLDAANLYMAQCGFIDPEDARFIKTVDAIERALVRDGLCFRYKARDDFGDPEASFSICTFWFIDALALTGRVDEARALFAKMLARANHLGLLSEGIHVVTGAMTGNFPQAYTHVAVINTARLLAGL